MKREEFKQFVDKTLEDVIQLAEKECNQKLSRKFVFRWFSQKEPITENIAEYITQKVFINEEKIFPCIDIGVGDVLDNGTLVIFANIAGYDPRPFQESIKGKDGPFVHIIGHTFLNKMKISKSKL